MIDRIGQEAVTIHLFIDKVQGHVFDRHGITHKEIHAVKKIVEKFLTHMKKSEYYPLCDKWAATYYNNILNHLDIKEDDDPAYLTWIQYQFHDFIHDVFPDYYTGQFSVKRGRFYKKVLERLLN